jgi:hypothetical protein
MKRIAERLRRLRHDLWIRIVHVLIECLEADLRGRALDWLYPFLEEEAMLPDHGRYGRFGSRYHREPRS